MTNTARSRSPRMPTHALSMFCRSPKVTLGQILSRSGWAMLQTQARPPHAKLEPCRKGCGHTTSNACGFDVHDAMPPLRHMTHMTSSCSVVVLPRVAAIRLGGKQRMERLMRDNALRTDGTAYVTTPYDKTQKSKRKNASSHSDQQSGYYDSCHHSHDAVPHHMAPCMCSK